MNSPNENQAADGRRQDAVVGNKKIFSLATRNSQFATSPWGFWVIARRDLFEMLHSPMAYVLFVIYLLVTGYFFSQPLFVIGQASLTEFMDLVPLILIFLVPAVTMRSFSDELKTGTFEILATLPLPTWQIVFGKFLASLGLVATALALTGIYPLVLEFLGEPDWGAAIGAYMGNFFLVAALSAIGVSASSMTKNQVIAYLVSWVTGFALFLAGKVIVFFPYPISEIINFLGFDSHVANIARGVLDS
ncbi:MAG: ABC transporter permease subunit, partial [Elusimicrobia bacterium]|nr:ABC transporter permease subunit [Elusimicrobiota bacterium]